jgi:general secretion pathway protein I
MSRGERGLTLLEMVVATLIMGIAVVGLLSAITTSMRNGSRISDYDRAAQLARGRMNELMLDSQFPRDTVIEGRFDRDAAGSIEAGWRARVTPYLMPPPPIAPGAPAMDRIELEVWWNSGQNRRTFSLEGYRTRVLKPQDIPQLP